MQLKQQKVVGLLGAMGEIDVVYLSYSKTITNKDIKIIQLV